MNILILLALVRCNFGFSNWSLSLSQSEINKISDYTFSLSLSSSVTTSCTLLIIFPGDFSTSFLSSSTCKAVYNLNPSLSCTLSTLNISISSPYSSSLSSGSVLIFTISGVTNPSVSKTTSAFQIYSLSSSGSILESLTSGLTATTTPKLLTSVSIIPTIPTAGILSEWTINTTLDYTLSVTGWISFYFPAWNVNYSPSTTQSKSFFPTTPVCSVLVGLVNSMAACVVSANILSVYPSVSIVGAISIQVTSGKNPPSLQPVLNVNVTVNSVNGMLQDFYGANVTAEQACEVAPTVVLSNEQVNTNSEYTFSFYTCNPVNSKSEIWVVVPSEIGIYLTSVQGIFGFDISYPGFSITGQTVKIQGAFNSYWDGGYLSFTLSSLKNPVDAIPSSSFQIFIYTNQYNSDYCDTNLTVTAASGNLIITSVTPVSLVVNTQTSYTFTFHADNSIPAGSSISITLPQDLSIANSATTTLSITEASTVISASYSVSSKQISIISAFPLSLATLTSISFTIPSITNPSSSKPTSTFLFQIYSGSSLLFQDSSYTLTATPSAFPSISISPSSSITGNTCIYTFSVTVSIQTGQTLMITLPSEISLTLVSTTCIFTQEFSAGDSCQNTASSISITVKENIVAGTLQVANIKNPSSTQACSVTLQVHTSDGFLVSAGSQQVQMSSLHSFQQATLTLGSTTVGSTTSYTLSIAPYNILPSTSTLLITSDLADLSKASCSVPFTCVFSSGLLVYLNSSPSSISLVLNNVINPLSMAPALLNITSQNSTYYFDYSQVEFSMQSPGTLSITLTSNTSLISQPAQISLSFTPSHPLTSRDPIVLTLPNFSSLYYNSTSFTSSITSYPFPSTSLTFTCTTPTTAQTSVIVLSSYHNNYMVDSGTYSFSLACTSPCANCSVSPSTCTGCSGAYPYLYPNSTCQSECPPDQVDIGNYTCSSCSLHCSSCTSTTSCTSCNTNYYLNGSACTDTCPVGLFGESGVCTHCESNCYTCVGTSSNCTSCSGLILYRNSCVATCPSVLINSVCYDCVSPCSTCTVLPTTCTSCVAGYSLFQNTCSVGCPDGTFSYANSCSRCPAACTNCSSYTECSACKEGSYLSNGQCVSVCNTGFYYSQGVCLTCGSNCTACQDTANYCVECTTGVSYLGNCLDQCPVNTTVLNNMQCIDCISTCQTCSVNISTCTSCSKGLSLYNSSCMSECPAGYFDSEGICTPCNSMCVNCNSTACLTCNDSYYIYSVSCVSACPPNTLLELDTCTPCHQNCSACINSTSQCTSCVTGMYLLGTECVNICPAGYTPVNTTCELVVCGNSCTQEMLNNTVCDQVCNSLACNYDNNTCVQYATAVSISEEPMSFTTMAIGGGAVSGTAAAVSAGSILPATISVSGALEWAGWVGVMTQVASSGEVGRRKLFNIDEPVIVRSFSVIFSIIIIRAIINAWFLKKYIGIRNNDSSHLQWSKKHSCFWIGMCGVIGLVSFKLCKIMLSGIFKLGIFCARFDNPARLYRQMLLFCAVDLVLVSIPMVCVLVYILSSFSTGSYVFVISLDVLIVTIITTGLSICYMFSLSRKIKESSRLMVNAAVATGLDEMDYTSEVSSKTGYEDRYNIIKKYLDNLRGFEKKGFRKAITRCKSLDQNEKTDREEVQREFLSFTNDIDPDNSMKINSSLQHDENPRYRKEILEIENKNIGEISEYEVKRNYESFLMKELSQDKFENSVLSLSAIEIEMQETENNFDFIEIDTEDFEIVRVKCKDLTGELVLKKSFSDGIIVDESGVPLYPQPSVNYSDLEVVEVLKDTPSIGIFIDKITGETLRIMRSFTDARVLKTQKRNCENYEFHLNNRREMIDSGVKEGHPLFWKFENPRVTQSGYNLN